jgi:poly-gamma-glutamate synthesis protein (capsule biosynthesis protein)
LTAPTGCVNGYQEMGVDLLTLANNHILDQNLQGLKSTINTLNHAGISYVGVGDTLKEAAKPYIFECDEKRIGIYACAEHEFSIVTENSAGANPIDLLESPDHVASLKARCDYVIVLYHGGKEHYRYPSPNLQKVCRKLVDKGADLVVCQHSHCIGCEEKYNSGTIIYGQGNFLFDHSTSEFWKTSLLVQIGDDFQITYLPLKKTGNSVRLAGQDDAKQIMADFEKRSQEIKDPKVLQEKYQTFADELLGGYLLSLSGKGSNFFLRALNKLLGGNFFDRIMKKYYSGEKGLSVWNYMECEAHRDVIIYALKNIIGR